MTLAMPLETDLATPQRRAPFGPVAALALGVFSALIALAGSAILAVCAAGLLAPSGVDAFLDDFGSGQPGAGTPGAERVQGFIFFLWGPLLALVVLAIAVVRRAGLRRQFALGGTFARRPMLIAAAATALILVAEYALTLYVPSLRDLFQLPTDEVALALAVAGIVIGAPVAEELLFRGFIYTALRERWGLRTALVLTSGLFAAMHLDPTGLYALLVLPSAVVLTWLREQTGGIAAPMVLHGVINATAVAVLLIERGL